MSYSYPAPRLLKAMGAISALSLLAYGGPIWADEPVHWRYGGAANPTQWGQLEPDFAACDLGLAQSPINLTTAIAGSPAALTFDYQPTPLTVANTGHTLQVNYAPGSTVTIAGEDYELLQLHFHTPSEHLIDGEAAAMELHLVHRNTAGELAVIGVMVRSGATHPTIAAIWAVAPPEIGTYQPPDETDELLINAADLLPPTVAYFSYMGSLTTPPCTEGVHWTVLTEPIEMAPEQIAAFERLYPVNARPVQPIHDRPLELHPELVLE